MSEEEQEEEEEEGLFDSGELDFGEHIDAALAKMSFSGGEKGKVEGGEGLVDFERVLDDLRGGDFANDDSWKDQQRTDTKEEDDFSKKPKGLKMNSNFNPEERRFNRAKGQNDYYHHHPSMMMNKEGGEPEELRELVRHLDARFSRLIGRLKDELEKCRVVNNNK